jgi:hypothetical protein
MLEIAHALIFGLGIAAYVGTHAYILLGLKAPAARNAYEQSRRDV